MNFNWYVDGIRHSHPIEQHIIKHNVQKTPTVSEPEKIHTEQTVQRKDESSSKKRERLNEYHTSKTKLQAQHVMTTDIITLKPTAKIREASDLFIKYHFRHIPIRNESNRLLGIVSDRDILNYKIKNTAHHERPIWEAANKKVLAATPEAPISEVCRVMFNERIGSMPIVDERERLVGLITRSDILHILVSHPDFSRWV